MSRDKKFLYGYLASLIFSALVLYFQGDWFENLGGIPKSSIFAAFFVATVVVFRDLAASHSEFRFLEKPLWGMRKTSTGYSDTSMEKHPYLVAVLAAIVTAALAYFIYIGYIKN